MTTKENDLRDAISYLLERIRSYLPQELEDAKLTFMCRVDGNPEADLVVTQDTAAGLVEIAGRAAAREEL